MEIRHFFGIGRCDKAGCHLRDFFQFGQDGNVLFGRVQFAQADKNRERLTSFHPGFVEGAGFDESVSRKDDVSPVGKEEFAFERIERPIAEGCPVNLQFPDPPKVRHEEIAERAELRLRRQVQQLEVVRLQKETLMPEQRSLDGHSFPLNPEGTAAPGKD